MIHAASLREEEANKVAREGDGGEDRGTEEWERKTGDRVKVERL